MKMRDIVKYSEQSDVKAALSILKENGVKRVLLYGSGAKGRHHRFSDIDLACEGISPDRFFKVLGRLLSVIERRVDLVDLNEIKETFRKRIEREGILLYEEKSDHTSQG